MNSQLRQTENYKLLLLLIAVVMFIGWCIAHRFYASTEWPFAIIGSGCLLSAFWLRRQESTLERALVVKQTQQKELWEKTIVQAQSVALELANKGICCYRQKMADGSISMGTSQGNPNLYCLAEDQQKYFPDSRLGKPFRLHYSKRADVTVERLQEIFGTPKYVKRYLPSLFLDIEWI